MHSRRISDTLFSETFRAVSSAALFAPFAVLVLIKRRVAAFIARGLIFFYSFRISQMEKVSFARSAKMVELLMLTSRVMVRTTRISPDGSVAVAVISA